MNEEISKISTEEVTGNGLLVEAVRAMLSYHGRFDREELDVDDWSEFEIELGRAFLFIARRGWGPTVYERTSGFIKDFDWNTQDAYNRASVLVMISWGCQKPGRLEGVAAADLARKEKEILNDISEKGIGPRRKTI